jgi:hypothetical protein
MYPMRRPMKSAQQKGPAPTTFSGIIEWTKIDKGTVRMLIEVPKSDGVAAAALALEEGVAYRFTAVVIPDDGCVGM